MSDDSKTPETDEVLIPIERPYNIVSDIIERTEQVLGLEPKFRDIAVYGSAEEPLYVAKHVCKAINIGSSKNAARDIQLGYFEKNIDFVKKITGVIQGDGSTLCQIPQTSVLLTSNGMVKYIMCKTSVFSNTFQSLYINIINDMTISHSEILQQSMNRVQENISVEHIEEKTIELQSGIYLVQPSILQNTNRYKFGISNTNLDRRIDQYRSGTVVLCKYYCENPVAIENELKIAFNDKIYFGNEYIIYDDKEEMISKFKEVVSRFISIDET